MARRAYRLTDYALHSPESVLSEAVARMGSARTLTESVRSEAGVLQSLRWSQAERDLIRLAAISRRVELTHRNDCCTGTKPNAARSPARGS
jgi:hypothetical protein